MPASDLDIRRTAHLFIQLHADEAKAKAREMVEEMVRKGDNEGADTWLRIIVAIGELGDPPSDVRHLTAAHMIMREWRGRALRALTGAGENVFYLSC